MATIKLKEAIGVCSVAMHPIACGHNELFHFNQTSFQAFSWYQLHNGDYKGILDHSFGKQLPTNFLQSLLDF